MYVALIIKQFRATATADDWEEMLYILFEETILHRSGCQKRLSRIISPILFPAFMWKESQQLTQSLSKGTGQQH